MFAVQLKLVCSYNHSYKHDGVSLSMQCASNSLISYHYIFSFFIGNTQIILGVTTSLLCIISIEKATIQNHITVINYVGVSYGVWIVIAGVIGIMSSKHPSIKIWYRANMGFNVFSAIASFAFVVLYVASIM